LAEMRSLDGFPAVGDQLLGTRWRGGVRPAIVPAAAPLAAGKQARRMPALPAAATEFGI